MTGYLIIYNIFQISVIQDIQSYGQLKTLGTTRRQIKKLISKQVMRLSCIGIPIGLLIGFFIGRSLVPFLMNGTAYTAAAGIKVSVNPLIFIGSAIFAWITVYISVRKPAKIAGTVSPVEAIRYTENDASAFKGKKAITKKSTHGAQIHRMALANLGRNKKRTILVIVSMTLSLVLFNTVFTLSSGFDIDKYVSKFLNKDFIISSADYFQYRFDRSDAELSQTFIHAVQQKDAYEDGGELSTVRVTEEFFSVESETIVNHNKDKAGNPHVSLYGADDFLLKSMEVIEGEIDWEALRSGKYVLYGLQSDDNGNIIQDQAVQVGDVLRFHHSTADGLNSTMDATVDLTVMAKVRINNSVDTHRQTGGTNFYMPTEKFKPLCTAPHVVNFSFNVKPEQEMAMEEFLTSYTENIEPGMDYESKQTYVNSFHDLTSLIITIGAALSVIIGLIGITNFINSMLTSIITRKKEFAMLQSIGMTGKQLKSMLACEGLYYAIGTILASAFFGTLFSLIIVQGIANSIWFFTYRFVIWPMLVIYPFLLALTIIIPSILYRKIAKTSIIERLRTSA
jgi:putative ABC transport system permease protein